jgi:hypothetical protein
VDNRRAHGGTPPDRRGQPKLLHTRRRPTGIPSTIHPQPDTTVQQADTRSTNTFHSPYYYCCFPSINFLLEEHPWGKLAYSQYSTASTHPMTRAD